MKLISVTLALPAVALAAHFPKAMYDSGAVHQMILNMKNVCDRLGNPKINFLLTHLVTMGCP